ncbi:MAG: UDP-2,3-diacylglucosamine diphosphatase [Syntrophaceae bacterium]
MKAVFLSDTHIKSSAEPQYRPLLDFLEHIRGADRLFILGDFFDFWFCSNRSMFPEFRPFVEKLLDLKSSGTAVSLFEGNHDFFLKDYFAGQGVEIYPEWADIRLEDKRLLLAHGDLVDTENRKYLCLRKALRSGLFYGFQKLIPPRLRWKLAELSSSASKGFPESREELALKMESFGRSKLEEGYDAVILGHCHIPVLKRFPVKGKDRIFCTLGDWITHFSYLSYDNGRFDLLCWK